MEDNISPDTELVNDQIENQIPVEDSINEVQDETIETEVETPEVEVDELDPKELLKQIKGLEKSLQKQYKRTQKHRDRTEALEAHLQSNIGKEDQSLPGLKKEDYGEDTEAYTKDLVQQEAQKMLNEYHNNNIQAQNQYARQQEIANEKMAKVSEEIPDLVETLKNTDINLDKDSISVLGSSPYGLQIGYYLAKNPEIAEDFIDMGVEAKKRKLMRLEDKYENQTLITPGKTKKKAPAPTPKTNAVNGKPNVDPDKMSAAEFSIWYRDNFIKKPKS